MSLNRDGHPEQALEQIASALPVHRETPMQLVWGERDFCFTNNFRDEWMRRFPSARVCSIPTAGHYLVEDATDEVLAAVDSFLKQTEEVCA